MKNDNNSVKSSDWSAKDYSNIQKMESFNHFVRKKNRFLFQLPLVF